MPGPILGAIVRTNPNDNFHTIGEIDHLHWIKIAHLNMRSAFPKLDSLKQELSDTNLHALCISETWYKTELTDNMIGLDGYTVERLDRSSQGHSRHGGGICIYVHNSINHQPHTSNWVSDSDIEVMYITLLPSNGRRIFLLNIYRPPNGNLERALEQIKRIFDILDDSHRNDIVLTGDFNVDLLRSTPNQRLMKEFSHDLGLEQIIDNATRCGPNRDTLLDHFYIKMDYISKCGTIDLGISDHKMIYMIKKKNMIKRRKVTYKSRNLRNFSTIDFSRTLSEHNWGRFYALTCPIMAWEYLSKVIVSTADLMCPYKEFRTSKDKPKWYTEEITEQSINMERLFRIGKRTKNENLIEQARYFRNTLRTSLGRCKKEYFSNHLLRFEGNPKVFWNEVNALCGKDNKCHNTLRVIDPSNGTLCEPKEVPHLINKFFIDIGPDLASLLPAVTDPGTLFRAEVSSGPINHISPEKNY